MNFIRYMALLGLLPIIITASLPTEAAGFLSSEDTQSASPDALMADVAVFKTIRQAMTLSIIRCETTGVCNATATSSEIQKMIEALDARVEGLSLRQQEDESVEGLEDVIVAYADERGGLSQVLDKIGDITSPVVENIDESELFGAPADAEQPLEEGTADAPAPGPAPAEEFGDLFADEDEEL